MSTGVRCRVSGVRKWVLGPISGLRWSDSDRTRNRSAGCWVLGLLLVTCHLSLVTAFAATHVTATYDLGANPHVMATVNGTPQYGLVFAQRNKPVTYGGVEYGPSVVKGYLNSSGQLNDGAGNLWLDLIPNLGATPGDSYYVVTFNIQGRVHAEIWVVPEVANVAADVCRQAQPPSSTAPALFYQFLQREGDNLPQRQKLNFTGSGVSCVDNAGQLRTDCAFSGGGGSSAPKASATVSGTVKTDVTASDPVVYLQSSTDSLLAGKVSATRSVSTSSPLSGGGALSADLTLACATCEVTGNKNAASGYAGLTASTKLTAAQGQEVWSAADLSDLSGLFGTSPGTKAVTTALGGDPTADNCVRWIAGGKLGDAGAACGGSHNLLSATHSDTTAASPVRGDAIFAVGATPAWQRLAHPTAIGGYFKWDGSDIVASTGAASGTGPCGANTWASALNSDAAPTCTQPAFSNLSGTFDPSTQMGTGSSSVSLAAGGTNENVTLTPTGTGYTILKHIQGGATLGAATGNETAHEFAYTTNKATSGDDTGLLVNWTDTASPGTSTPFAVNRNGSQILGYTHDGLNTGLKMVGNTSTNTLIVGPADNGHSYGYFQAPTGFTIRLMSGGSAQSQIQMLSTATTVSFTGGWNYGVGGNNSLLFQGGSTNTANGGHLLFRGGNTPSYTSGSIKFQSPDGGTDFATISPTGDTSWLTGTQDFESASVTRPFRRLAYASFPGTCTANREFLERSDPATAGQVVYVCNSTGNGWDLVGDGGGGGGGDITAVGSCATGDCFQSETTNKVFASPDGSTGQMTPRALAANDIPNLDVAKITTGVFGAARGGTNNAYFQVSGPASSAKTFTFPNADATIEYQGNKNAASGYAGLDASSKLTASQGQEVWGLTDLTDVSGTSGSGSTAIRATFTSLAANDIPKWNGSNWVNSATAPKADALTDDPGDCSSNQFANAIAANGNLTCSALTLASAQFANQGTSTTVLHGNAAGNPSWSGVSLTADAAANQGTASQVLHGNASGQPSWGSVSDTDLTAEDFGDFTCTGSEDGCTLDTGIVNSNELVAAHKQEMKSIVILDPATSQTDKIQLKFANAVTLQRVSCSVDAATDVTIQFDERAEGTPNTAGTNVLTANLVCTTSTGSTTSFSNAGMAADAPLNLQIVSVTGSPTVVRIHIDYQID